MKKVGGATARKVGGAVQKVRDRRANTAATEEGEEGEDNTGVDRHKGGCDDDGDGGGDVLPAGASKSGGIARDGGVACTAFAATPAAPAGGAAAATADAAAPAASASSCAATTAAPARAKGYTGHRLLATGER